MRVCWWHVSFRQSSGGAGGNYGVAFVAVAGNLALAAADVNTGVAVGLAPQRALRGVDEVGGDGTARDGGVEGRVLGRGKARKGRGRNDEGGVEHGWCG